MKAGTESKSKFKKLQRRLGLRVYQAAGLLEMLWQITARDAPAGDIGKLSDEDIAACLDWEFDEHELIDHLVDTGWLERSDVHRLIVHDWEEHAPQWVRGNLSRHNKEFARGGRASCEGGARKLRGGGDDLTTKSSQAKPSHTKPSQVKSEGSDIDHGYVGTEDTWQAARVAKRIGLRTSDDPTWLIKVCALVRTGRCTEAWLWDAVTATERKKPRNPGGYLRKCLSESRPDLVDLLKAVNLQDANENGSLRRGVENV